MKITVWISTTALCLGAMALVCPAGERPRLHPLSKSDRNITTCPAIGSAIPAFEAVDQNGARRAFENLKGPEGLVLLFVRSADW